MVWTICNGMGDPGMEQFDGKPFGFATREEAEAFLNSPECTSSPDNVYIDTYP